MFPVSVIWTFVFFSFILDVCVDIFLDENEDKLSCCSLDNKNNK